MPESVKYFGSLKIVSRRGAVIPPAATSCTVNLLLGSILYCSDNTICTNGTCEEVDLSDLLNAVLAVLKLHDCYLLGDIFCVNMHRNSLLVRGYMLNDAVEKVPSPVDVIAGYRQLCFENQRLRDASPKALVVRKAPFISEGYRPCESLDK